MKNLKQKLELTKHIFGYTTVVKIQGKSLYFLIDTGAQKSMISAVMASKLTIPTFDSNIIIKSATEQKCCISRICRTTISIGNCFLDEIELLVMPKSVVFFNGKCDGILGVDILRKRNYQISFINKSFEIQGYNYSFQSEIIPMFVNGNLCINAIIDTASKYSWITYNSKLCNQKKTVRRPILEVSLTGIKIKMCEMFSYICVYNNKFSAQCCNIHVGRCVMRYNTTIDIVIGLDILRDVRIISKEKYLFIEDY